MPKKAASALPRSRSGKGCTTMAWAAGNMIAPPAPWMTRKTMIQASARLPFGVSPHRVDAPANVITPIVTIFRGPTVSASLPPSANSAASDSRYALTAHCTPVLVRPSSFWISGTAIDTMVWSMNVIETRRSSPSGPGSSSGSPSRWPVSCHPRTSSPAGQ